VSFIDPKGLTRLRGFDDPKIRFHKTIKGIEDRLGDPNIVLNSFILSNTYQQDISWWKKEGSKTDFSEHHILFQKEDKEKYIEEMICKILTTN